MLPEWKKLRDLSSEDMNEHGFTLLCGADCKIFPTGLTTGVPDGLLWEIPIEGYVIFGRCHRGNLTRMSEDWIILGKENGCMIHTLVRK